MPPKAKLPAPIDRPLSRAYARQFKGWSTAYPPGMSDPTSFRIMENVVVGRDQSVQIRPALRQLLFRTLSSGTHPLGDDVSIVGSFEPFYLNTGVKAYLYAAYTLPTANVQFYYAEVTGDPDNPLHHRELSEAFAIDPFDDLAFTSDTTYVKYLQIDNKIFALSNAGEEMRYFTVGNTKTAKRLHTIPRPDWTSVDRLHVDQPAYSWTGGAQTTIPTAQTPDALSLVSGTASENIYNFGYFYTYFNEVGETGGSQISTIAVRRHWSDWYKLSLLSDDPKRFTDQIVAVLPNASFSAAWNQKALGWHLYMFTWSNTDTQPVEAIRVATTLFDYTQNEAWNSARRSWAQNTVRASDYDITTPVPTLATRRNYSDPSSASNGIVAADRMVLVGDPNEPAVIRWSSNLQGEYANFSATRGGGIKTLTSGNLYVPATVKLWQNPQSVDSLAIMCRGTDGQSTGYYMAPAEISSQSESTSVMGFEETSATPGTTSPFGCEVFNSALIHPLEDQIQKSTAANYAIRHKSLTDLITFDYQKLINKDKIVSSEHDGRIYFLVHNPDGAPLENRCNGNEIWVLDANAEVPTWNRWLIQAASLRKIEDGNKVYMSVIRPDGIYALDRERYVDEYTQFTGPANGMGNGPRWRQRTIPWRLETNTQGANRAHDAWAYLKQVSVTLGNFQGSMVWGVRGLDVHGKKVNVHKVTADLEAGSDLPWDREDFLQVNRTMKEWFFYASSDERDDNVLQSHGQISLIQMRYAPSTVNSGTEFGSVETFEYGRDYAASPDPVSTNGVPMPYVDTGRP